MKEPNFTNHRALKCAWRFNSNKAKRLKLLKYFRIPIYQEKPRNYQKHLFLYLETFLIFAVSNKNFNYEIF
jgi:hypothetical protein